MKFIKGQRASIKTEFKKGNNAWVYRKRLTLEERFLPRINMIKDGCWEWIGDCASNGYCGIKVNGKMIGVHRVSYELFKGKIQKGLTIDHLCKNKKCVNPDHLEAVTQGENTLRSDNPAALNKRKTHCKNGHAFSIENTYINPCNNQRVCRICHKAYKAKRANYAIN